MFWKAVSLVLLVVVLLLACTESSGESSLLANPSQAESKDITELNRDINELKGKVEILENEVDGLKNQLGKEHWLSTGSIYQRISELEDWRTYVEDPPDPQGGRGSSYSSDGPQRGSSYPYAP